MTCKHCDEEIDRDELVAVPSRRGIVLVSVPHGFHLECWMRLTIGSVGHQLKVCSCFRGDGEVYDDPPGLSVRDAAIAAFDLAMELRELDATARRPRSA
jgi:hypothetical protein